MSPAFPTAAYLRRIGLSEQTGPPTLELLAELQLAHLVAVPFENLHVYHRRSPRTGVDWSVPKIVEQGRGGWCFELNGAFAALLRAVGFTADHVACRVWEGSSTNPVPGGWGPEFDHLATVVHLAGERWFVDVGFGDCCVQPLPLADHEQAAVPRAARMEARGDAFVLHELMPSEAATAVSATWTPQLHIDPTPRALPEFDGRCRQLQDDPTSMWHQKPFATRALDGSGSRVTLRSGVLRVRTGAGPFVDQPVASAEEWDARLAEWFNLEDSALR